MCYSRSCPSEDLYGRCAHSGIGPKACQVEMTFREGDGTDVLCPRCISHFRRSRATLLDVNKGEYRCPVCEETFEAHDWLEMYSSLVRGLLEEIAELEEDNRQLRRQLADEGKKVAA